MPILPSPVRFHGPRLGQALRMYFLLALGLVVLTLALQRLQRFFDLALLVPYLVLVALAGRWGGLSAAVFTSLATVPLVDYFLLGPQGRLDLTARQTLQFLVVLLAGLLLGWVLDRLRSERARAEMAVAAERSALAERDELLTVIAHDLRSPLTAIKGRIQLAQFGLKREPPEAEAALKTLGAALPQVDRVGRLLDDLLATGRTDGGTLTVRLAPLDLAPLLAQVAERWRQDAPNHRLELEVAGRLPVVGDAGRLEQILDNLLANAVKYSPLESAVHLSGRVEGDEVRLAVADEGEGIPPDEQPRLFERFYRRPEHRVGRQPGIGLGLFITRELVHAHAGRIWVESIVGSGATFVVTLPIRGRKDGETE